MALLSPLVIHDVSPVAVPVQFVNTHAEGVPIFGVVSVGEVARTGAPLHCAVVHTGSADAPPHTRISVVAPFASVCCAPVAVVPVAISEYAVVPVERHVPPSATAISVAFQVPEVIVQTVARLAAEVIAACVPLVTVAAVPLAFPVTFHTRFAVTVVAVINVVARVSVVVSKVSAVSPSSVPSPVQTPT